METFAGKPREKYQGMSNEELDNELQLGNVEAKVKELESVVDDVELDTLQMENKIHDMKVAKIRKNLITKYGSRNLNQIEFMLETGYGDSKAKDFFNIYGSYDPSLIALRLVHDAQDDALRAENRDRLLSYIREKWKLYDGVPVQYLGSEVLMDDKEALKIAKKKMGVGSATKIMFIDHEIVCEMIMDDI